MSVTNVAVFPAGSGFSIREFLRDAGYDSVTEAQREKRVDFICMKGGRRIIFCVASKQPEDGSLGVQCLVKPSAKDLLKEAMDSLLAKGAIDFLTYEDHQQSVQQSTGANGASPRRSV